MNTIELVFKIFVPFCQLFPVGINLYNVYTLTKFKLKTHKFQYLKLNLVIDAMLFLIILFQPLTECQEFCSKWWNSNYWLIFFKIYIYFYFSSILNTISTLLNLTNIWSRYKIMNKTKIPGNLFYFILSINFFSSFILYFPYTTLNEIVLTSEMNDTIQMYMQNVRKTGICYKIGVYHVLFSSMILLLNTLLVFKLGVAIQKIFSSKPDSKSVSRENLMLKRRESIILFQDLFKASLKDLEKIIQNLSTIELEFKTTLFIYWITIIFAIDQFSKGLSVILFLYFERNSKEFKIGICIFFLTTCLSQITYTIIFVKLNRVYSDRLKILFDSIVKTHMDLSCAFCLIKRIH